MDDPDPRGYDVRRHVVDEAGTAGQHRGQGRQPPDGFEVHWHRDADPNANRAWLVRNTIGEVGKGLLSGQWGTYKTFIVLDLSGCVMTGEPFAGQRVLRRGGVLFIAPEGASEIPVRLRGLVAGKLRDAVTAHAAAGRETVDLDDLPIAWIEKCPRLVTPEAADALARVAEHVAAELRDRYGLPLVLIVVDTVAAGAGFDDENSAAETQKAMGALEQLALRTGAFVLGVDHFGKAVETGTRGSSAKEAAADTVLAALGQKDEAGNVSNTRLAVRKVRGARAGREIPYEIEVVELGIDPWGDPITTCIVRWESARPAETRPQKVKDPWTRSMRVLRAAILNVLASSSVRLRPFGATGPEVVAARQDDVRREFVAAYPADGETEAQRTDTRKKAFQRALRQAVEDGLIATRDLGGDPHLWLTDASA